MSANWKTQAKAADYDRLRDEIDRLRAALEPFASLILPNDTPPDEIQHFGLPADCFFAARAALETK